MIKCEFQFQVNRFLTAVYLFEIATASLLPVHHVMEDGDHDIPQIRLRHQRHLQEWTNHRWDEVQLVLPWRRDGGQHRRCIVYVRGDFFFFGPLCLLLFEKFNYNTDCSDNLV